MVRVVTSDPRGLLQQNIVTLATQGDWLLTGCSIGQLWQLSTGQLIQQLTHLDEDGQEQGSDPHGRDPWASITAVCFFGPPPEDPDTLSGLRLATCSGQLVCTWDAESGICLHVLAGHEGALTAVTRGLCTGYTIITGAKDCTARLWEAEVIREEAETINCTKVFRGHAEAVSCVVLWGDKVVTGSIDFSLRVWNVENEMCAAVIEHNHVVRSLCVHLGSLFSVSHDGWLNLIVGERIATDGSTEAVGWPFELKRIARVHAQESAEGAHEVAPLTIPVHTKLQPWALCSLGREGLAVASLVKGSRTHVVSQVRLTSNYEAADCWYRFDMEYGDIRAFCCADSGEVLLSCVSSALAQGSCRVVGLRCHVQPWSKTQHKLDKLRFQAQVSAIISCNHTDGNVVASLSSDLVCSLFEAMHYLSVSEHRIDALTFDQV